jgi:CubicO group peptidase (beta-lactamase class C family)
MTDPLSPDGLERFAEVAAGHSGPDKVPGLVALVSREEQVHVEALGSLSVGGPPIRRDSMFRIASTSKPVTGAATMALVDEGVVRLDDPVEDWLPELADRRVLHRMDGPLDDTIPAERPINVRDLLTFTFGFGMVVEMFMAPQPWPVVKAATDLHLGTLGPPNPDEQPDPDTWMAGLGSLPLLAQPGQRWMYNTGASVLGVLAARAAGMPFADVLRTRLFEPLGMRDTGFWVSDHPRLATAYAPTADRLQVWDPPDGQWSHPPAFADGAAGLVSTADDLLAFARMFLAGGASILSKETVAQMTRDQLTASQRAGTADAFLHGRSWSLSQSVITEGPRAGAFGWDGGLGTSWLVDPARDLVVIVLTQRLWESPQPPAVHDDLQDAAYAALT